MDDMIRWSGVCLFGIEAIFKEIKSVNSLKQMKDMNLQTY